MERAAIALFHHNNKEYWRLMADREKLNRQLLAIDFSIFFNEDRGELLSYAQAVTLHAEETKQVIFELKELSGSGNYPDVETWTLAEVLDYTDRKTKQIQKQNEQYRHKH